jgi:hypothetical protein
MIVLEAADQGIAGAHLGRELMDGHDWIMLLESRFDPTMSGQNVN